MPKAFKDHSDQRNKAWCIHCGQSLSRLECNRDHVPSKALLVEPFPDDLAVTTICKPCNESFSRDEEYVGAFLSAVLSGTTEPLQQKLDVGRRVLERNPALRARIERGRRAFTTLGGEGRIVWEPEHERVRNVIVKNARGHVFHENGEPMLDKPAYVDVRPLEGFSGAEYSSFIEDNAEFVVWPEVGSRWMQRLLGDPNFDKAGFLVVQPDVYRFKLVVGEGIGVKAVIHEYLATTVLWA